MARKFAKKSGRLETSRSVAPNRALLAKKGKEVGVDAKWVDGRLPVRDENFGVGLNGTFFCLAAESLPRPSFTFDL